MTDFDINHINKLYRDFISPDLARLIKFSGYGTVESKASGSVVTDVLGRDFLDFSGGYGVFSLGHTHPKVVAKVQEQVERLPLSPRVFLNPYMALLAEKLAHISPGKLQYSFLCNSGTEAVEAALKIAKVKTGRHNFIVMEDAFHGKSLGSLSFSGREKYKEPFRPLLQECRLVPLNDIKSLERAFDHTVAGVLIEPVQGEGGIHIATQEYMEALARLCKEQGALLIADEVQSGLGRTGRMFAMEHYGIAPDIMTLAKALGGGVMPIGACIYTAEVAEAYKGRPLLHTSTFGGNALASVAALTTLEVLEEENLVEQAQETGSYFLASLLKLAEDFPCLIQEARGVGLMLGLELRTQGFAGALISALAKEQIIAVYTLNQPKVLRFEPPLSVSKNDIDKVLIALRNSLEQIENKLEQESSCQE